MGSAFVAFVDPNRSSRRDGRRGGAHVNRPIGHEVPDTGSGHVEFGKITLPFSDDIGPIVALCDDGHAARKCCSISGHYSRKSDAEQDRSKLELWVHDASRLFFFVRILVQQLFLVLV